MNLVPWYNSELIEAKKAQFECAIAKERANQFGYVIDNLVNNLEEIGRLQSYIVEGDIINYETK